VTQSSPLRLVLGVSLLLAMLIAGVARTAMGQEDADAVHRCTELLPGLADDAREVRSELHRGGPGEPTGVRLTWRGKEDEERFIICWFVPLDMTGGAWQISTVESDEFGHLSRYDVQQLYKFLRLPYTYPATEPAPTPADPARVNLLYLLQQTINGISLGCLYALVAVGFTLVYGITGVINFAFGEIYMLAAFVTFIGYLWAGGVLTPFFPVIFVASLAVAGAASWSSDRLVFRPLRGAALRVPLIAAIGLSILLKDAMRLLQGPQTRWLPYYPDSWALVTGQGFDIYLSRGHLMVGGFTICAVVALWWIGNRTDWGRGYRACAQDPKMAALLGVNVDRTIGLAFLLGGGLMGLSGIFAAVQYGIVDVSMGTLVGLKALTAAVLGGIGSVPGALLGGLVSALVECYTAAAVGSEWKDIAVFLVLILVLVFRPAGLLGTDRPGVFEPRRV
jgi:branched-chain amino acid transport system permease protein